MMIGVSTACLYPMEIERSIDTLLALGFRDFECFLNTECELSPSFVEQMKHQFDAAQAKVISIHPFTSVCEGLMLFSEYPRRFSDAVEFYKRYFEAARTLGAKILVLHGAKTLFPVESERYFERFDALNEVAKSFDVTVAQENVNGFKSESPAFLKKMRQALGDRVKFVLDIKQSIRAGYDPYQIAKAMEGNIIHVHANDHRPQKDCLLPGRGCMDYQRLQKMLLKEKYLGKWIIEVYRTDFDQPSELKTAKDYLQNLLEPF